MTRGKSEQAPTVPFEEALKRLEETVRQLEAGSLTLEDSLKAFAEGIRWSRCCEERLTEAKGKIEQLVTQSDGSVRMEPFAPKDV